MICQIQTAQEAQDILETACEDKYAFGNLIFDLNELIDPFDVPVNAQGCTMCVSNRIYGLLGGNWKNYCPRCDGPLHEIIVVDLVIQGNVVLATGYRS